MFTKETRLQAALEGKLPEYIMTLVSNCLETGNAYGKTATCDCLTEAIKDHAAKTETLLFLGVDAKFMACEQALKAIKVLDKAGVDFTVLENEASSGVQLDFLIGAANETKAQMEECAKVLSEYKTVVVYDPNDAKAIKQLYKEYGIEVSANVVTYTSFVAGLLRDGKLEAKNTGKDVVFQDPYQLSRDLEETEEAREIVMSYAVLGEMLLNRAETVWAGNILMAQYMPEVIKLVAKRRIFNATSVGANAIVTASVSEYVSLKAVAEDVEIISIEDLILGE
jgi:Fe-S oxidoreductase